MKETTVKEYFNLLLSTPRIAKYIVECKENRGDSRPFNPRCSIIETAGSMYAGITYNANTVCISSWILVDDVQTKAVVRHELAHALHFYSKLGGNPHGKEFNSILRIVSPRKWRTDKHWVPNITIEKARGKVHKIQSRVLTNRIGLVKK